MKFPAGTIVKMKCGRKIRTAVIVRRYSDGLDFLGIDVFSDFGKEIVAALGNPDKLRELGPRVQGHREMFYDSQVVREVGKSELSNPDAWGLRGVAQ
jgi:hypothetical protein